MKSVNVGRALVGAIVAAIVLFVISGILNGAVLGHEWQSWQQALGNLNHAPSQATGIGIWALASLAYGLAGLWIYAGIRTRYGAGAGTAVRAGIILWVAGGLTQYLGHRALDDIPQHAALLNCVVYLFADPLALIAGAFFYKE